MGFLLVSVLMTIPVTLAYADDNELQESDKLYMTGDVEYEDPVSVVIQGTGTRALTDAVIEDEYAFEKSIFDENETDLFNQNSKKVTSSMNNLAKRTVTVDAETHQMLVDFTKAYLGTYVTKEYPNLNAYYDLSTDVRKENELLVASNAYRLAVTKSNTVSSVENEVKIKDVTPVNDSINEVLFFIDYVRHTDAGDEGAGEWCLAYVTNTAEPKLLKVWIQSFEFEDMQKKIKEKCSSGNLDTAGDTMVTEILKDYESRRL